MKDTNASIKLKNDEPKDKHASRRPTSQGQLPSNQPKNKNRDISKLEENLAHSQNHHRSRKFLKGGGGNLKFPTQFLNSYIGGKASKSNSNVPKLKPDDQFRTSNE